LGLQVLTGSILLAGPDFELAAQGNRVLLQPDFVLRLMPKDSAVSL
jgi:hypothetical protein